MSSAHEEEQAQIARVQGELASLWLQGAGQVWQGASSTSRVEGIETILPSWSTLELASLEELGAIPATDVDLAWFDAYIAKFGEKIDDILSSRTATTDDFNQETLLSDLPRSYLGDPASFSLDDQANWEFANNSGGTNLQLVVDSIDEALFREALKRRKDFDACQRTIENLKDAMSVLARQVTTQRAELQGTFRELSAAACLSTLKRRKENLQRVIRELQRIEDTFEAIEDMQTVLKDENATDAEYKEVMHAYKDVRESVSDMEGRIQVVDQLLSGLTEEVIIQRRDTKREQLIMDGYRERMGLLKTSLRADKWRYVNEVADSKTLLEITGGTVCEDGKILLGGRSFGVVASIYPLVGVLAHLMEWAGEKAQDVAPLAIKVFRVFNGMTSQLVLGAAAIESEARLPSITIKHLAIAREQIDLALWIAEHVVMGEILEKAPEFQQEFDLCLHELGIHADEIRSKIVSVAVELLVPQIKNAATAMGSNTLLATIDDEDGIMPYFKDIVDGMLRTFRVVAKVTRGSFPDADAVLEEICANLVTWIRDAGTRASSTAQIEVYQRHLSYLRERFSSIHASASIDKVYDQYGKRPDVES